MDAITSPVEGSNDSRTGPLGEARNSPPAATPETEPPWAMPKAERIEVVRATRKGYYPATVEAAAAVERLWPGRGARFEPLAGGITNRNYRVDVDGSSYVLRIGGRDTSLLGIDRSVEHAASLRAAEVGVGPAVLDFIEPEGWLVTRFLGARPLPPEELRRPENIARVAGALRRVHEAAPIPGRFDAHAVVEEYRRVAEAHGVRLPAGFAGAHATAERIRLARGPQPLVPCHNDLLNANFLDDGEVRIVDWEYAGMGDRFFDLANLSVNHEFALEQDRLLLAAYFGKPVPPTSPRCA